MMHVCGKCKACKPKTKEFFYFARGIVNGACKECRKAANKKNAKEKRELKAKQSRAGFTCCECGEKRDSWLLHSSHGKTRCKICKAYRDHRRTKAPLPFVRFEIEWLHIQYDKNLITKGFKRCTQCSQIKPFDRENFGSNKSWCKCCQNESHRQRPKEKRQQERRSSAEKNGKAYTPMGGSGTAGRRQRGKAAGVNYYVTLGQAYERHMDRLAEWNAYEAFNWWIKNKASAEAVQTFYADKPWNNPRLTAAERYRIRYAQDPEYQIRERIRRQINKKLKRDGIGEVIRGALCRNGRSKTVEALFGYSIADLRQHIERKFKDGMTWDAFMAGQIHIDHIKPQAAFNLQDDDQWRECWSMSNLQPLWADENIRKMDRLPCGRLARHARHATPPGGSRY